MSPFSCGSPSGEPGRNQREANRLDSRWFDTRPLVGAAHQAFFDVGPHDLHEFCRTERDGFSGQECRQSHTAICRSQDLEFENGGADIDHGGLPFPRAF